MKCVKERNVRDIDGQGCDDRGGQRERERRGLTLPQRKLLTSSKGGLKGHSNLKCDLGSECFFYFFLFPLSLPDFTVSKNVLTVRRPKIEEARERETYKKGQFTRKTNKHNFKHH